MTFWNPTNLSSVTLVGYYRVRDPDGAVGAGADVYNGSAITNWIDRSGNGNTLSKSASGLTYNANGLATGYPAIGFDGSVGSFSIASGLVGASAARIGAMCVIVPNTSPVGTFGRVLSLAEFGQVDSGDQGSVPFVQNASTTIAEYKAGFGGAVTIANATNTILGSYPSDASNYAIEKNTVGSGTFLPNGTSNNLIRMAIGAEADNIASNLWTGALAEMVVWNGVISTDDLQKMQGYIAWNNGQQALLPGGHPYAGAAPTVSGGGGGGGPVARKTFTLLGVG